MQYIPKAYLTYALNKDGNLVHIDSVPNGNNCGCFCPHCKEELCARNNGEKRIHHFSHKSGADCAGAIESALHIMAKEILQEIKCVQLPNIIVHYIIKNEDTAESQQYDREESADLLKFDKIDVECTDIETNLRPDCIGYYGDKKIWIEFKRTHAVDEEKKAKIIAAQVDCIEIDINSCELDYDAVRKFIKDNKTCREWINNISNNETQIISVNDRNYVKDENGNVVNILKDNVDTDKHSYYCLGCGKKLFPENKSLELLGQLIFVHDKEMGKCSLEQYAGIREYTLHKIAKKVMQEIKRVLLPNTIYIIKNEVSADIQRGYEEPGNLLRFDKIDVECTDIETNLRPDCIGYYDDKKIWIIFKKTHAVDEEIKAKIIASQIDCIEIDINSCELDYDAVREFINDSKTYRKWINNTRNNETQIIRVNDRNYVKDENGNIINIQKDNVDTDKHSYYCLGCGKKLFLEKNYLKLFGTHKLSHVGGESNCYDKKYLYNATKEMVYTLFNHAPQFYIYISQQKYCEKKLTCPLYNKEKCCRFDYNTYNLKEYYTECIKDFTLPDIGYKCDLIIKNSNSKDGAFKNAIIVKINGTNANEFVLSTKYRIIEFNISTYKDLENIPRYLLQENQIFNKLYSLSNFKTDNNNTISENEIKQNFTGISLFSSGKYYINDSISCIEILEHKKKSIYQLIFISNPYYDIFEEDYYEVNKLVYFLHKCYKKKLKACYCELCFFIGYKKRFPRDINPERYCKRYKTKGTPHYPIKENQIDCQYFQLDSRRIFNIEEK